MSKQTLTVEEVLNHPDYSHSREKFYGTIATYRKDPTSPSGLMFLQGFDPDHWHSECARLKRRGTPHSEHPGNL